MHRRKERIKVDFRYERIGKILEILKKKTVTWSLPIDEFKYKECDYKKDNVTPVVDDTWRIFHSKTDYWGGESDKHCWFYKKIVIPNEKKEQELELVFGEEVNRIACTLPQGIAYVNGKLVCGLDSNHRSVTLSGSEKYEVYVYSYTGTSLAKRLEFSAILQSIDKNCEKLYYDIYVPYNTMKFLNPNDKIYTDILNHLNKALNLLDLRVIPSDEFEKSVSLAIDYLREEYYEKVCREQDHSVICTGHTHIDVAWLWSLRQTREKVQRSFSNVLRLMEKYPEYQFMSSQPQLYQFLKEESPETYEEVKKMVKAGRWEVEGAMWVEADCNLSSGESLVRQILMGKRFFKKEFGKDSKVLWLPDVFGYSAALPQILHKSGVDKFLTSKISWNETNQMPYDTFLWVGIDGTEVLSYFLTAQDKKRGEDPVRYVTYSANTEPSQIAGTWDRYQQKELNHEVLLTFGYGDGGGGPTKHQLEVLRRQTKGVIGCPNAKIDTVSNFFQRLFDRVKDNPKLPKWVGELYLEYHRGTYTSIAKNKRNNRQSELLLQNCELLSIMNLVLNEAKYPQKQLNQNLELILLNQFHDIIPGSSIKEVYDTSDEQYAQIRRSFEMIQEKSYKAIASKIKTEGGVVVFNPHSFDNSSVVSVGGGFIYVKDIPAKGYKVITPEKSNQQVVVTESGMENAFFIIDFDESYNFSRIYDKKNNREVLKAGEKGNTLLAFEDIPRGYDAWEITNYYTEKQWEINEVVSSEILMEGARGGIKVTKKFLNSTIIQKIYIYHDIAKIDFDTTIDWKEEHILVKTAFPVDIHTDKATYDIQFGNVERPTHRNTSWDSAKFEVCAHKFVDLSEYGYGVSLLNDCKYGHDALGNNIRLTLIKSATYPNPDADKEKHTFVYSLYPHRGGFREAGTIKLAYDLNLPMTAFSIGQQDGILPDRYSLICCDKENVIIETVKKAEDGEDIIFRMYECFNQRTNTQITFGFDLEKVTLCNLMEEDQESILFFERSIHITIKPYEIVTLKVKRRMTEKKEDYIDKL